MNGHTKDNKIKWLRAKTGEYGWVDWFRLQVIVLCLVGVFGFESFRSEGYAVIVGIDTYAAENIPDLSGAVIDAKKMQGLLAGDRGYRFASKNIKVLTNEEATLANFEAAMKDLADKVGSGDVVVVYFAGYGSVASSEDQLSSGSPEKTLVFFDSRHGGIPDLTQSKFNQLLAPIHKKTEHLVVIEDAGGNVRFPKDRSSLSTRTLPPTSGPQSREVLSTFDLGADLGGVVYLRAAGEHSKAHETGSGGVFTSVLVDLWSRRTAPTYTGSAQQIQQTLMASYRQRASFQGHLSQSVLGHVDSGSLFMRVVAQVKQLEWVVAPLHSSFGANSEAFRGDTASLWSQPPQQVALVTDASLKVRQQVACTVSSWSGLAGYAQNRS